MRQSFSHLLVLVILIQSSLIAQSPKVRAYEQFDIRNSSGQVLDLINSEYQKDPSLSGEFAALVSRRQQGILTNAESTEQYIRETNQLLRKAHSNEALELFLAKTKSELVQYGVDVAANYAEILPSKYLHKFVTPAIQRGVELSADKWVSDKMETERSAIDEIIRSRINLLYSRNGELDLTSANDENSFAAMFAVAQADIPALNREDYAVFNRELVKYAFRFLAQNRAEIRELRQTINRSNSDTSAPNGEYELLKRDYDTKITSTERRITDSVKKDFSEVGDAIANLTKNQGEIYEKLSEIQSSVKQNQIQIKTLEGRMATLKRRIAETEGNVQQMQANFAELRDVQNLHTRLISENSLKLDVLTRYTFTGLTPKEQLEGLRRGDFDSIFGKDTKKRTEYERQLEKIVTVETIVSVSNRVAEYSTQTYNALVESGVLKGQDAKKAGQFLHYLVATSQLVSGSAKLYAGDISGIFSVAEGLGGLIGGVKKPRKSAEFQLLEAVYAKLQEIESRIIDVQKSIIEFRNDVIDMYRSLSQSLQIIQGELELVLWKQANLQAISSALLFRNFNVCKSVETARTKANITFEKFSDYESFYTSETGQCLRGLSQFTITFDDTYFHLSSLNSTNSEYPLAEEEIRKIFNPTLKLFKTKYSPRDNDIQLNRFFSSAKLALMFPVTKTRNANKPLFQIFKDSESPNASARFLNREIDNYLNYEMLLEYTRLYLTYSSYFEISWDDQAFKPETLESYLSKSVQQRLIKRSYLNTRVENLIRLIENSIMQQSLLAGNTLLDPIYSILFAAPQNDVEIRQVNEVLKNNRLLAYNFATHMLHKNLQVDQTSEYVDRFRTFVDEIRDKGTATPEQLESLNKLLYFNGPANQFTFKLKDDRNLYISYTRLGESVDILVPSTDGICEGRMINSDAIALLLDARESLRGKIVDQNFTGNISQDTAAPFPMDAFKFVFANKN